MESRIAHELNDKWRSDHLKTNESKNFDSFNLDARILAGLAKAGYKIPSPVQLEAIPLCQTGKDTFVQGVAGTGKTLVFSILALTRVLEAEYLDDLQVLIVAPTREGACHIYETLQAIGGYIRDLKLQRFIGGLNISVDKSNAQTCNVAVGTPGRICQLIDQDALEVDTISLFVIDDVDNLLDKFMRPEVSEIFDGLPANVQTVVTSLTSTDDVVQLANEYLKISGLACICNKQLPPLLGMKHYHRIVPFDLLPVLAYRRKLAVLKDVLLKVKYSQCIIFCNAAFKVELVNADIKICGLPVSTLVKAMDQVDRLQALEHLKKNKCKVLITTDVGSRGLDAKNVDLVVNFDIPFDSLTYLHRCGRAGRYGTKCSSITFLTESQKNILAEFENDIQFKSFVLPEPIPEVLNCDINPSEVPGLPCKQPSSEFNKPVYITTNLIELSTNVVSNQEKTNTGESLEFLEEETLPKSTSKTSKDVSHEEFNGVQLKKEQIRQNKFARISCGTKEKKTSDKSCSKKPSRLGCEKQVMFSDLKTVAEFDPVKPCKNFYSGCPDNHADMKKVCMKHNLQSKCIDRYVNQPNPYYAYDQRSSSPGRKILVNRHCTCCSVKPSHSSQLCPFPNYNYPNHFQMHRETFYHP